MLTIYHPPICNVFFHVLMLLGVFFFFFNLYFSRFFSDISRNVTTGVFSVFECTLPS